MFVIPAIDLKNGKCVRLFQGDFGKQTVYSDSPVAVAEQFFRAGAQKLHLVDLDGARAGRSNHGRIVEEIVKSFPFQVELGGGIRTLAQIEFWLEKGVNEIILGTAAVENPDLVKHAIDRVGKKHIVIAVDVKDGYVASRGWLARSSLPAEEFGKKMKELGVQRFIFTDVSRDGTLSGPNVKALVNFSEAVRCPVTASGGVRNEEDVLSLFRLQASYIDGIIVGKAIYEGRLNLERTIQLLQREIGGC